MSDIRDDAARYIAAGMRLVRLKPGEKAPLSEKGWPNASPAPEDFLDDENIGVQLGRKSGHLVDLDFDIPEARALGGLSCFFGGLTAFRRESQSPDAPGHRLVVCRDAPDEVAAFAFTTKKEKEAVAVLALPKATIFEVRAGKGYTCFPPSVIAGDPLVFNADAPSDVPEMGWTELRRRAGLLAFASFAAACFPDQGARDQFAFHLAGVLAHLEVPEDDAEAIITETAKLKADDWRERGGKARGAIQKRAAGEAVTGLPEFLKFLGMEACEKRLRGWLGTGERKGDDIPDFAIEVGRPRRDYLIDELESEIIVKMAGKVFRRLDRAVRLNELEREENINGSVRRAGLLEIKEVGPAWLSIALSRAEVAFFKRDGKGNRRLVPPPDDDLRRLLAVVSETRLPPLRGVTRVPTLTRSEPGYDQETGLFLAFNADDFPSAPALPTPEQAKAALERLSRPLRAFPYEGRGSRSVVLSALLSGVVRDELQACPLHCISAPTAGTGKTKNVDIAGVLATGVRPSLLRYTPDEDEMEKRLAALFNTGDKVINLDNVNGPLTGNFLSIALTSPLVKSRRLGESEHMHVSTRALLMATGNNIRPVGELVRRSIICRLDAGVERPELREFDFDPVQEVQQSRASLVVDALTVLRGFIAAGRPLPDSYRPLGSFEDWDLVRGALVWLGEDDPVLTQDAARDHDEERETRNEVLRALHTAFGTDKFNTRRLEANDHVRSEIARHLKDGEWNRRRAVLLLKAMRDAPCSGRVLRSKLDGDECVVWWVEATAEKPEGAQPCPF